MSTIKNTAPEIRPQFDTHHEGVQAAFDMLHDRRSALGQMIEDARQRGDNNAMFDLDLRHAEVCGLLSTLRARASA